MVMILILRRLLAMIPTLLGLSLAIFLMVKAIPGDPAMLLLGDRADAESLASVRADLGLDRPWYEQYGLFLKRAVVDGDLGRSIKSKEPITTILADKFPATIELAICAILFAMLIGIPMGLLAAIRPGSIFDVGAMSIAVVGVSMPIFWLALMLIWLFGLLLGWLPLSGRMGIEYTYEAQTGFLLFDAMIAGEWGMFWDAVAHLVLPAIALGTIPMAFFARITRGSMLEVTRSDYVRTARAKGLAFTKVYLKHAFKNAAIPILTVLGLQFGLLLGGAIITETVFAWPGLGRWLVESVAARDVPAIEGGVLIVAVAVVTVNLLTDLAYRVVDPRVRVSG